MRYGKRYVKCNHCGYYPSTNGYYCANCGNLVNNTSDDFGCLLLIIAIVLALLIGSIFIASYSLYQLFKKLNYRKALWWSIGGIVWSIFIIFLIVNSGTPPDPETKKYISIALWSNVFGLIESIIAFYLYLQKSR